VNTVGGGDVLGHRRGERGKKGEWAGDWRFVLKAAQWRGAKGRGKRGGGRWAHPHGGGRRGRGVSHRTDRWCPAGSGPRPVGAGGVARPCHAAGRTGGRRG
jgi:hypothetical protein